MLEFYETDELNGQFDNWFGPSVGALEGMCRAAGFARVQTLAVDRDSALVACYRTWEPEPAAPACDPPELLAIGNVNTYGINFNSRRDQYAMCWFRTPAADLGAVLSKELLHLEVGRFGAPAVHLQLEEERRLARHLPHSARRRDRLESGAPAPLRQPFRRAAAHCHRHAARGPVHYS